MDSNENVVLVDTDVYSYLMKAGDKRAAIYEPHLRDRQIALSFVTVGELYFGAIRKEWGEARLEKLKNGLRVAVIVPYDIEICRTYARIKAALEKNGESIGDNDLWIAACGVRHSIPLVSNNRKHFERVPDLILLSEQKVIAEQESQRRLAME